MKWGNPDFFGSHVQSVKYGRHKTHVNYVCGGGYMKGAYKFESKEDRCKSSIIVRSRKGTVNVRRNSFLFNYL